MSQFFQRFVKYSVIIRSIAKCKQQQIKIVAGELRAGDNRSKPVLALRVTTSEARMRFTQSLRNLNKLLDIKSLKMLDNYSQYNPTPLTIKQFLDFGQDATEEESFTFLRKEIPVRFSNIMKEINLLPGNLLQMPSILVLQVKMALHILFCSVTLYQIKITKFLRIGTHRVSVNSWNLRKATVRMKWHSQIFVKL